MEDRYAEYERTYGDESWELDAIGRSQLSKVAFQWTAVVKSL